MALNIPINDHVIDNVTESKINATCEIYAAATLLKTKLMDFILCNEINISVNTIRLFQSAVSYLDSIATIQWKIYVRKYKIFSYL